MSGLNAFALHYHLEILLAVSLFLSLFRWGKRILFPFQIFTTWVHECWHGMAAVLMGGGAVRITMDLDGSGLTQYQLPKSRLRQSVVASAGYLGSSLTGCLIFFLSAQTVYPNHSISARGLVFTLCVLIIFSLVFWMRNGFSVVAVTLMAAAIGALNTDVGHPYAREVLIFLGIQTALNALFDIRVLFSIRSKKGVESDAHTLQKLFFLPAWFWALSWLAVSIYFIYFTMKLMRLIG